MKREKFQTRRIILRGPQQRDTLLSLIPHLPLGLEVVIREEVKVRGLDANGYYWLRLGEIAEQAYSDGKQYSSDVWHEYMKRYVMPDMITTKDGVVRSKWLESPDGRTVAISTTLLERGCFAEYTTAVEAFGAGLGVMYSANPNDLRRAA